MTPRPPRRRVLRAAFVGFASVTLAGCTTDDIDSPEDRPGRPDIQLKNCYADSKEVRVVVTYLETGESVYDETHVVPGDFCSDAGPSYNLEAVWTEPGAYRVRVEVPGIGASEATVDLSEQAVGDDTATRSVYVDDGEIEIG
ncbi:hypothetical protein ACFQJ6_10660 [Halorussus caseinilyticus]|uniref:Uncharacterized protein n=1 Tax=Halorussus caseinilyticus TaxID=3034025 RepID=A0ABD5WJ29_9EURY|nr:hypothetical protein [Halorussus sp. DT72]